MAKFIDAAGLQRFKVNLDAANLTKFVALDANGVAKADQLPSYVDDVIDMHVETVNEVTTYYSDNAGVKGDAIATGERGKIYIDIDTGAQYRWSGSQFVQISSAVSTADRAVNDADGNSITATYATKAELTALADTIPTNPLTVGDNISVDSNGAISLTASNVTGALGYTPLSESNVLSNAEIDALFA